MVDLNNLYCMQCGDRLLTVPYKTNTISCSSPRYENHGGILPICRKCAKGQFEIYLSRYKRVPGIAGKKLALFRFCESYDFPFVETFIPKNDNDDFLFNYLRQLWGLVNTSKKKYTFDDSKIKSEKKFLTKTQIKAYFGETEATEEAKEEKVVVPKIEDLKKKWGNNNEWSDFDYEFLETTYNELVPEGVPIEAQTKQTIESCCMYLLIERQKLMEGDTSAAKSARDAMDKAFASVKMRLSDQKEHKEALVQDIVSLMEQEDIVEPWDSIIQYDHTLDLVEQVVLILVNDARRMMGAEPYRSLEQAGYKLEDKLGQCLKEPPIWELDVKKQLSIYSQNDDYKDEKSEKDEERNDG